VPYANKADHNKRARERYASRVPAERAKRAAWRAANKDERNAYSRAWYAANKERMQDYAKTWYAANLAKLKGQRRVRYLANSEAILEKCRREYARRADAGARYGRGYPQPTRPPSAQCECCGRTQKRRLALDHCHETLVFRGWLCSLCNLGIGKLGDSVQGVEQALAYLKRAAASNVGDTTLKVGSK
jgi:hypothetical protein